MANIKISDLTAASAAADANEFEINEAGTSKKVTGSQLKAYVNSGDGALASKNTVATADIDNLAVTTAKIAADAIDGTKIANDAINSEHYAADSIDTEHYAPGSVDAAAIAANAVGASELNVPGNGTSGQYLASDGDGTMTWTTLPAGGGFSNLQVFNNPGTWTNPGNVEKVKVTVQGGGGAGVGSTQGVGGAGGGATIEVISFPTGTNVPVTVGNGGTVNYAAGNPGGSSSFGAYCSANGGAGAPNSNNAFTVGGNGVGGNINFPGQGGHKSMSPQNSGGQGGNSHLGQGGSNLTNNIGTQHPVMNGRLYGGGGCATNNPGARGGNGAKGIVIVEY